MDSANLFLTVLAVAGAPNERILLMNISLRIILYLQQEIQRHYDAKARLPAAVSEGAAVFSFALSHLILTFDAGNEATVLHI